MAGSLLHPNTAPFRFDADGHDVAVLLHGWTGSPAHFRPLGRELQHAGVSAVAPLLAGHGTTIDDLRDTTWRDWLRSAVEAAHGAVVPPDQRLHLVGLSMGGLLALLMAPTLGAATVTTINAPIRVFDWKAEFSWLVRGRDGVRERLPEPPPAPEVADYYRHYERSPIGTVADLFDLVRATRRNLDRVECPVLVIQSRADQTVRPESADRIARGVSSRRTRVVWLQRARHVALVDDERTVIRDSLLEHVLATH